MARQKRIFKITAFSFLALMICTGAKAQTAAPNVEAASVYSAPTVRDFLAACRTDQDGCVDEVGDALMDKMRFDGSSDICFDSLTYGRAVPGWLTSHPGVSGMNTEDGIYTALKALYPCQ